MSILVSKTRQLSIIFTIAIITSIGAGASAQETVNEADNTIDDLEEQGPVGTKSQV